MPRVPKPSSHRLAAPPDAVRAAAVKRLGGTPQPDGTVVVEAPPEQQPAIGVTVVVIPDGNGSHVTVTPLGGVDIPFFGFFFRPLVRIAQHREVAHVIAMLEAALADRPDPDPPKPVVGLPPVVFSREQATLLATASAAAAVVGFASALFGQLSGPISDAFHASDSRISLLLAITRIGALLALPVTVLADRRGRRRSILIGVTGSSIACAISAVAPNLLVFTSAQVLQRGLLITTATVAGIAVIEQSPERARAYSASMLALAGGFGFSLAVVVLPLADLGNWGWRLPFALGACTIFLSPSIARHLAETTRYTTLSTHADVVRGRLRDVITRHRRRFVLLGAAAFLTSLFNAPSSQLMNQYLLDDRGFSNTGVALFRTVTTAVPGLIGIVLGGRLAEARGRRPVAAIALAISTASQMVFFLMGGPVIWVMSAISVLTAGAGGIALGTLDAELFPTEVRGTSNALLTIVGVIGSATGFGIVAALVDPLGGLGRAIALTGIGSVIAAIAIVPRLPESAAQDLDDVSPTRYDEYGPDP
jgi:MFS family permease